MMCLEGNAEHGLVTAVAFWNPVCFRDAGGMQCVGVCQCVLLK